MKARVERAPSRKGKRWTRVEMREYIWAVGTANGRVPTMADLIPYHNTVVRLFGSIANGQKAAGFLPNAVGRPAGRVEA
jgi:hypothetical protein